MDDKTLAGNSPDTGSTCARTVPVLGTTVKKSIRGGLTWLAFWNSQWFKRLPPAWKIKNACLLFTLAVACIGAFALAVCDLKYVTAIYDWLGVALLAAIGAANFLAFVVFRNARWWAAAAFIAQALVLLLALYVIYADYFKSPQLNPSVMWVAVAIGLLAFIWLVFLRKGAMPQFKQFTTTAVILSALVPLAGAAQFYLQSYYIPHTSESVVDLSTELSPQGKSPSKIHLSAKVTLHNRSSVKVTVGATLMRITTYPSIAPRQQQDIAGTQDQESGSVCRGGENPVPRWCQIVNGLDLTGYNLEGDFRSDPTPAANAQLLYAAMFAPPGMPLDPGETDTFQRVVDIDPAKVRLARLSVSASFLTERTFKGSRSCRKSRAPSFDGIAFPIEVNTPEQYSDQTFIPVIDPRMLASSLCIEYQFEFQNVIDRLIGRPGVYRAYVVLNDPQKPNLEYPQLVQNYFLPDPHGDPLNDPDVRIANRLLKRNPVMGYTAVPAEYAPGDPIKTGDKG